ncbi:nucleoside 2-deoxyribosyltransferase [Flammeovirga kamogawensis]|uniref:Putative 2'-deoxynucleoside 5'-phosphate N-hydrolase 1 n=1 Tax=Flammeovirga kamogawensis TaxID=373891 RepID=A0ABX8GQV2_9BACT|nr:nucleoside 2-deoxyribosyltransferase [Flammeovirga kamogawensis]MBB6462142.1 nucleoside 2-deoxyribosyltransferase [Flammeovirga kamogawensis]QWG05876.1 nucleoside 2-deoxyribosyltransferase [Flammeovirga kamogawensis]TRX67700.1 nucleoside 2-deoxyribosyltransferase [Flammeovirga kamogawensis]
MKIYFSGAIRGGREDAELYAKIIQHLQQYGDVLTEHIGQMDLQEKVITDIEIHNQDLNWLIESDIIIAEVTVPSLGVGYELGRGVEMNKPTFCFHRSEKTSAMVSGCSEIKTFKYNSLIDLKAYLDDIFQNL